LGKEMATEMLFFSQRLVPSKLEGSGFPFRHPELEAALRGVLGT
jgi:NAD dependent epimerase/dehydratase family enzyme